jgi:hypothetical protein
LEILKKSVFVFLTLVILLPSVFDFACFISEDQSPVSELQHAEEDSEEDAENESEKK